MRARLPFVTGPNAVLFLGDTPAAKPFCQNLAEPVASAGTVAIVPAGRSAVSGSPSIRFHDGPSTCGMQPLVVTA
jgi:hypothetical protein